VGRLAVASLCRVVVLASAGRAVTPEWFVEVT